MTRAREAARLIGNSTFRLDSNNAVGFNSTTPDAMFDINAGLTVAGIITATSFSGTATNATTVTVANESTDTTCFPLFATAATGNLAPKSGTNLTFNSNTGTLESTNLTLSGDLTVQGTTTTLDTDLIGVDKVEVGANNSTVGLAVTQSGSGSIIAAYDGSTEVVTITSGGNIRLSDSTAATVGRIEIGDGQDLQIYHDGGNSIIDSSTGDFLIRNLGTGDIYLDAKSGERGIKVIQDGAVELYHNNAKKFETTAEGVDISGTGSIKVPVGTTAQRNGSPTAGDLRYNSDNGAFEGYTSEWGSIGGFSKTQTWLFGS
jgi:hypothetical protein